MPCQMLKLCFVLFSNQFQGAIFLRTEANACMDASQNFQTYPNSWTYVFEEIIEI